MERKEIEKEFKTIDKIQKKYINMLTTHMKLKKEDRNSSWESDRRMLFHLTGALSMARAAFAGYVKNNLE